MEEWILPFSFSANFSRAICGGLAFLDVLDLACSNYYDVEVEGFYSVNVL